MPLDKESRPENHQQDDLGSKYKTTRLLSYKNLAKKQVFTIIILLLIGVIITIFVSNFFNSFRSVPDAPNKKLIEYLETQRRHYDSLAVIHERMGIDYLQSAIRRESLDSQIISSLQSQLKQSINHLKPQYEKIPSYRHVDRDSLRRLFANRFQ